MPKAMCALDDDFSGGFRTGTRAPGVVAVVITAVAARVAKGGSRSSNKHHPDSRNPQWDKKTVTLVMVLNTTLRSIGFEFGSASTFLNHIKLMMVCKPVARLCTHNTPFCKNGFFAISTEIVR